ncbi:hypothetical protein Tco_0663101 [Tanacetum coccineum]
MPITTGTESEFKDFRTAVDGRLGTLETYVEKNHKELIELIQTLADHVTILSDRVMPPASNKEDLLFRVISKGDTTKENPSRSENIMGSYGADFWLRKLKMPIFEREDAYGWIYRMEWYFDIQGIEDIDQLTVRLRILYLAIGL